MDPTLDMDYLSETEASDVSAQPGTSIFGEWAHSVGLDTTIRDKSDLPKVLDGVLRDSKTVPHWILNQNAPEYGSCRHRLGELISSLSTAANQNEDLKLDDDEELSQDVIFSLYSILGVPLRDSILRDQGHGPTESNRRAAVEILGIHSWDYEDRDNFQFRNKCILNLPGDFVPSKVTIDSTVSIKLPEIGICASLYGAEAVSDSRPFLRLLHWVIEYQSEEYPDCTNEQVLKGLAYGLHQRRTLGYGDQFVFGMAHHSTRELDVLAAGWQSPKSSMRNATVEDKEGGRIESARATSHKQPEDSKILVYRLATFNMGSPLDMLQLYLLMRSTRVLGQQYKAKIVEALRASMLRAQKPAPVTSDELPGISQSSLSDEPSDRNRK